MGCSPQQAALTASKLYSEIIPHLVSFNHCQPTKCGNVYIHTWD